MKDYQKKASVVFVVSSILFGIIGILFIMIGSEYSSRDISQLFVKALGTLFFIIVSSFAVSVGLKYLFK